MLEKEVQDMSGSQATTTPQQEVPPTPPDEQHRTFLKRRLRHWFQDIFLVMVIILNVLDFFEILPGDLDFIKRILSWILLGYLMYHVNLAKLFFGKESHEDLHGLRIGLKPRDIDFLIILAYFSLLFKNMIHFATIMLEENRQAGGAILSAFSEHIMRWLAETPNLSIFFMLVGFGLLLIISIIATVKYDIRKPSIMAIIHEEGDPDFRPLQLILRFVSIFIILMAFYIIVFNLFMEWLAFAIDAPIIIVGILFYVYLIVRQRKKFDPESLLFKIGNFGESFYEPFLKLFYTRKGLFLALTGLLLLHLLSDIGNFIIPHITGLHDALYFSNLNPETHVPLFFNWGGGESLIMKDLAQANGILQIISLFWVYIFNVLGILCVMTLPAYIWYKVYISKGFNVAPLSLGIFFCAISVTFLAPLFEVAPISQSVISDEISLTGADIKTQTFPYLLPQLTPTVIMLLSMGVFLVTFLLAYNHAIKSRLTFMALAVIDFFLGYYIYIFASDYLKVYTELITMTLQQGVYISAMISSLFAIIVLGFYSFAYLLFIFESAREYETIH